MCFCSARSPQEGGCPFNNHDPRICLDGEFACEFLAEKMIMIEKNKKQEKNNNSILNLTKNEEIIKKNQLNKN